MDDGWKRTVESWERVAWARSQKYDTAKEAADALGMNEWTYSAYERRPGSSKHTKLSHQRAAQFGEKFGFRWDWLLLRAPTPFLEDRPAAPSVPLTPEERVVVAFRSGLSPERAELIAQVVEDLAKTGN
jgi:hypothetical protein